MEQVATAPRRRAAEPLGPRRRNCSEPARGRSGGATEAGLPMTVAASSRSAHGSDGRPAHGRPWGATVSSRSTRSGGGDPAHGWPRCATASMDTTLPRSLLLMDFVAAYRSDRRRGSSRTKRGRRGVSACRSIAMVLLLAVLAGDRCLGARRQRRARERPTWGCGESAGADLWTRGACARPT